MPRNVSLAAAAAFALSQVLLTVPGASARPADPPGAAQSSEPGGPVKPAFVTGGGHDNSYVPITPCRIIDSNASLGGNLRNGVARTFYASGTGGFPQQGGVSGGCGIPTWAVAVTGTISAIGSSATGFLRAWAAGRTEPSATALLLNPTANQLTGTTLPITATGITVKALGGNTRFVMDVTGYYAPAIFAVVSSNGTLLYSSRLTVTAHPATGSYTLTADTTVSSCSVIAAGWGNYSAAAYGAGSAIYVNTLNSAGAVADAYFQVTVTC